MLDNVEFTISFAELEIDAFDGKKMRFLESELGLMANGKVCFEIHETWPFDPMESIAPLPSHGSFLLLFRLGAASALLPRNVPA